jgi:branched-chain amino acid transport system substrate-binding protein
LASKVRSTSPDLVYFGGISHSNAGKLLKDLRVVLGNNFTFMGSDGIYDQVFLDNAGDTAEGSHFTFGGVAPAKLAGKGAEWYANYKKRFNAEPEAYAGYGYEAMQVALDAIRRAGRKDRTAIRDALFATTDHDGILGRWSFDQNGDTTSTAMSGRQVRDGRFDDDNAVQIEAPR